MKKQRLFFLALIVIALNLIIFSSIQGFQLKEQSFISSNLIMKTAIADSEDHLPDHHFCWRCIGYPYQETYDIDCQETGYEGCVETMCGYNYCDGI